MLIFSELPHAPLRVMILHYPVKYERTAIQVVRLKFFKKL
jgi:hypothetical protein